MTSRRFVPVVVVGTLLAGAPLGADTLYLRSGRKVEGELVAVRGDTVEFRERGGWRGGVKQYDRREVRTIELDERGRGDDRSGDRPRDDGRPGGLREREIVVSADVPWNDTGVEVRAGQELYFSAVGRVQWGKDRRDGAGGEANSPYNPTRPMPRRPAAALIGKIGDASSDFFFIGDEPGPFRVRSSGRLYLGINDDYLADNRGNFRVVVSY